MKQYKLLLLALLLLFIPKSVKGQYRYILTENRLDDTVYELKYSTYKDKAIVPILKSVRGRQEFQCMDVRYANFILNRSNEIVGLALRPDLEEDDVVIYLINKILGQSQDFIYFSVKGSNKFTMLVANDKITDFRVIFISVSDREVIQEFCFNKLKY